MKILVRALIILLSIYIAPLYADQYGDAVAQFRESAIAEQLFKEAYGYAIFPSVGKGGLVLGGAYGEGRVYRGNTYTGDVSLTQVSIGFQLGGQTFSEIIFFQDKKAFDTFTSGSFSLNAQASAVAIAVGASAQTGTNGSSANAGSQQTDAMYTLGMAVLTETKGGLMYEASVGGQKFTYHEK